MSILPAAARTLIISVPPKRRACTRTRILGEARGVQALWIYNRFAEEKILRIGKNRMKEREKPSSSPATPEELKVFISSREAQCDQCGKTMAHGAWITLVPEAGARCLACADLDDLVFLPSGNAALTRRARAHSVLSAVVLKWSRARKRYERQGLLVQEAALSQAESECLADAEARELRRGREAVRREGLDEQYVAQFAAQIRALYPGCAPGRETVIAEHACLKHGNRVGRAAFAKALHEEAVHLAVHAHIRHAETNYDELLGRGLPRDLARRQVQAEVHRIAARWQGSLTADSARNADSK
jgi:hypothetical protein